MQSLRSEEGTAALALMLTASRTSEVLLATKDEFDVDGRVWRIPGRRMKGGEDHIVYLTAQAIEIIQAQLVVHEAQRLATNWPGDVTKGMGWTVPTLSEEIVSMSKRWKMPRAEGVADDAIFARSGHSTGSIADEFNRCKVYFTEAKKADRLSGWTTMKRRLGDAGKTDVPGLYASRACCYFWETVPYVARDLRRTEDVATDGPDHAADGCSL